MDEDTQDGMMSYDDHIDYAFFRPDVRPKRAKLSATLRLMAKRPGKTTPTDALYIVPGKQMPKMHYRPGLIHLSGLTSRRAECGGWYTGDKFGMYRFGQFFKLRPEMVCPACLVAYKIRVEYE